MDKDFNAFHLEIAVITDRLRWVLQHSESDSGEMSVIHGIADDLTRAVIGAEQKQSNQVQSSPN